jgi:hypothetical protein
MRGSRMHATQTRMEQDQLEHEKNSRRAERQGRIRAEQELRKVQLTVAEEHQALRAKVQQLTDLLVKERHAEKGPSGSEWADWARGWVGRKESGRMGKMSGEGWDEKGRWGM